MDKEKQELKIRIAQKTRPLKSTINALKDEIAGLNLYRKKQNQEIAAIKDEIERKDEAIVKAKLEIEKQQTWTGHDWEQNYISGAIARKIHRLLEQAPQTDRGLKYGD